MTQGTHREIPFTPPMECLPVDHLPDGPGRVYEILCGPPHKSSSVALDVMWRRYGNARGHGIVALMDAT